jgi:hypothetical protein
MPEPRRVVAVDLPDPREAPDAGRPASVPVADAIPQGARWPDADDAIGTGASDPSDARDKTAVRNPWEVRAGPKAARSSAVFLYGGIIAGAEGGPVAFVNGRAVREGDVLGKFNVARIADSAVVIERAGAYFVLPRGRRTTITTAGG